MLQWLTCIFGLSHDAISDGFAYEASFTQVILQAKLRPTHCEMIARGHVVEYVTDLLPWSQTEACRNPYFQCQKREFEHKLFNN